MTRGRSGSGAEVSELQFKHGGSFDQEVVISSKLDGNEFNLLILGKLQQ